ncbi:maker60, partial [Drosophila busckii]
MSKLRSTGVSGDRLIEIHRQSTHEEAGRSMYRKNEVPRLEQRRRAHSSESYRTPTHVGGLFAINREYFLDIGAYNPGLLLWNDENFQLSFKIWQCGVSIDRGFRPYNF